MGRRSGRIPVYGQACVQQATNGPTPSPCNADDICLTQELVEKFAIIVGLTEELAGTALKTTEAYSQIIVKADARVFMNDWTYVRFVWMTRHPGYIFDPNNLALRREIKDIYLGIGSNDWRVDPLVNTLP